MTRLETNLRLPENYEFKVVLDGVYPSRSIIRMEPKEEGKVFERPVFTDSLLDKEELEDHLNALIRSAKLHALNKYLEEHKFVKITGKARR